MKIHKVSDRDLAQFLAYASRERGLDALLQAAQRKGATDSQMPWLDALRDFNVRILIRETKGDPNRQE